MRSTRYASRIASSRFDSNTSFGKGSYDTPGWQRAQQRKSSGETIRHTPKFIEGELAASSANQPTYEEGERVFHQKFGYGNVTGVDGNKLTVDFDKAGEKRVIDSFVERG